MEFINVPTVDVEGVVKALISTGKMAVESGRQMVPMAHFGKINGQQGLMIMRWPDSEKKKAALLEIKRIIEEIGADFIALLSEAWLVSRPIEESEKVRNVKPAEAPDRQEAILVEFASKDGNQVTIIPFTRIDGEIEWGKKIVTSDPEMSMLQGIVFGECEANDDTSAPDKERKKVAKKKKYVTPDELPEIENKDAVPEINGTTIH